MGFLTGQPLDFRGVAIRLDPSWVFVALLVPGGLASGYGPGAWTDISAPTRLMMACLSFAGLVAAVAVHTLAHAVAARWASHDIRALVLFPFGGRSEPQGPSRRPVQDVVLGLAGPAAVFLLSGLLVTAAAVWRWSAFQETVAQVLLMQATLAAIVALFNLLPAPGLDGARLLDAVFRASSGATAPDGQSGVPLGTALAMIGCIAMALGHVFTGLLAFLLGRWFIVAPVVLTQSEGKPDAKPRCVIADVMTVNPVTVSPDMTLAHLVNQFVLKHDLSFFPVVEKGDLLGMIDRHVLARIDRDNWANTRISDVYVDLAHDRVLSPGTSLRSLLALVAETGQHKFLVAEGRRLIGVVTLADLFAGAIRDAPANRASKRTLAS
ncbi:CBS domain-containing protein [Thalassococcus sp. CAU 1522]|uniref:CBS domain-containing protein n=1 Tax=Thalassococcus arenae TaxID=2851652 RepID=A0ABS6N699_9RHOB|nr:CBS domain-containing protein [Thalassococcus arenae]MBV2359124.1 CBS domain-containing protein [Thalassococcus arenae]